VQRPLARYYKQVEIEPPEFRFELPVLQTRISAVKDFLKTQMTSEPDTDLQLHTLERFSCLDRDGSLQLADLAPQAGDESAPPASSPCLAPADWPSSHAITASGEAVSHHRAS